MVAWTAASFCSIFSGDADRGDCDFSQSSLNQISEKSNFGDKQVGIKGSMNRRRKGVGESGFLCWAVNVLIMSILVH